MSIPIGNPQNGAVGISSSMADAIIEESQGWDNFTLPAKATISGLTWKGAYNNVFNPDGTRGDSDFVINFHRNLSSNAPDLTSTLATFSLDGGTAGVNDGTNVRESIVPNEKQRDGGAIVTYETDLSSFDLEPGTYWLSIQAIQTLPSPISVHDDPQWSWVLSGSGDGIYSYDQRLDDSKPGYFAASHNATFALLGEMESTCVNSNGDINGNGLVDFADFLILSTNFGQEADSANGDIDCNGTVNFTDFLILSTNFGQNVARAEAVPEPNGLGLLALGSLALGLIRRRR